MPDTYIYFAGLSRPLRFINCQALLGQLHRVLPTWPFRQAAKGVAAPIITVERRTRHYRLSAPWLAGPLRCDSKASVASSIIVDLIYAWLGDNPAWLCLHAAAAQFAGRLVVFPSTNRAGKSLLMARLLAAGHTVYSDDLLAFNMEGQAMAFGVPPRLRPPLPPTEEEALGEFVRAHLGLGDKYSQFVEAPAIAPFGRQGFIGAFVMLKRHKEGAPGLSPAPGGQALRNLVYQNLMREASAHDVLSAACALTEQTPCWLLRYSNTNEAYALLREFFAEGSSPGFSAGPAPGAEAAAEERQPYYRAPARGVRPSAAMFVARPGVRGVAGRGEFFLTGAQGSDIFHLNAMGWALWQMLATPLSELEAVALLQEAFSSTPQARIERDVMALFAALKAEGLIVAA